MGLSESETYQWLWDRALPRRSPHGADRGKLWVSPSWGLTATQVYQDGLRQPRGVRYRQAEGRKLGVVEKWETMVSANLPLTTGLCQSIFDKAFSGQLICAMVRL